MWVLEFVMKKAMTFLIEKRERMRERERESWRADIF
jgi:hypothetical protein